MLHRIHLFNRSRGKDHVASRKAKARPRPAPRDERPETQHLKGQNKKYKYLYYTLVLPPLGIAPLAHLLLDAHQEHTVHIAFHCRN